MFLIGAGIAVYKLWPDVKHGVNGYSFKETLQKTTDAAGADARVLTLLVRGQDFSYAVVNRHGDVLERFYGELCTSSTKGNHCVNSESHHQRVATAHETQLAKVRLADISPEILGRLRHDTGATDSDPIGIRRGRWVIAPSNADPYIADADGSNLHPAGTQEELALARTVATDSGLR